MWGSRIDTTKGKELYKAIKETNCEQSTGRLTYWPTDTKKIPDLIDFFNFDLVSDHTSIVLTLSGTIIKKPQSLALNNRLTDREGFRKELEEKIKLNVPLKTKEQIDVEAEQFVVDLQQGAWNNKPKLNSKTPGLNYLREVREMVAVKRKARKKWQQTRSPENKRLLNKLCEQHKQTNREIKNESLSKFLSDLSIDKKRNIHSGRQLST